MSIFLEIAGTIAFAAAGAAKAIDKRLDVFGVIIIAILSAVGGGIIRDIVIGNTPPYTFKSPIYILMATISGIAVIFFSSQYNKKFVLEVINILDAIGLAVFTVSGINVASNIVADTNAFLLCFVGVVTAVGGGVLRDVLMGCTPVIFRREIYAVASIIGSILYINISKFIDISVAGWVSMAIMCFIRIASVKGKLNLPIVCLINKDKG